MKRLARLLLLLPLLGAAGTIAAPEPATRSTRYIPASGWDDDWEPDFYEGWVGNQLRAMNEPILSGTGNRRHFVRRIRLLVLPNDDPAYAIRVDEGGSGRAAARFVILDGSGGYSPGRIAEEASFDLSPARKRRLDDAIRAARLESAPRQLRKDREDGSILICVHATHYVFELLDSSGTHVVTRDCDLAGALADLAREFEAVRREADPAE